MLTPTLPSICKTLLATSSATSVSLPPWSLLVRRIQSVNRKTFCLDLGAAYGTAKSGVGIASMGVLKPELIFKSIVPIIMAGILGIYGLIVAVILQGKCKQLPYLIDHVFNLFFYSERNL